jgi:hypothetical protein
VSFDRPSHLGTFAGYIHDEALCVQDLRPASLSGRVLQLQERGVSEAHRSGQSERLKEAEYLGI